MQVQDYLKQGLAAGAVLVCLEYLQKVKYQNVSPYDADASSMLWAYAALLLLAALCYWAVVEARKDRKGIITFGQAFFVSIYVAFIASLLVGGFYFAYGKYIDPNEAERMAGYLRDELQGKRVDPATVEQRLTQLRSGYSAPMQFMLGMKYLIYGLFISLVIAAVSRRKSVNPNTQP
ncbi:MAG TPA: DUF4199 domain-containing protein [Chitinophagales bacterium]|nr:DUF4199 domain-containing protein [Chitinophagales bacterium]